MPPARNARGANRTQNNNSPATIAGIKHGKHFCRVFDAGISYVNLIDYALEMWEREDRHVPEPDDIDTAYTQSCSLALEKLYDSDKTRKSKVALKLELRHGETGETFRAEFIGGLIEGHGQGHSDDLSELKKIQGHLNIVGFGFASESIMAMLMTMSLLASDSLETRDQLRTGVLDASSTELYAGLFENNMFPVDSANPFKGFLRSTIFIYALKTIFTGPASAKGNPSSGARSKSAKNNMTSLTLALLAHIATLLCFALHSPGTKWYRVSDPETDNRFDYGAFYNEVVNYLEAPGFEADCADLLAFLNRAVFPNAHRHPRRINVNAGPTSMVQIAANARAARARAVAPALEQEVAAGVSGAVEGADA